MPTGWDPTLSDFGVCRRDRSAAPTAVGAVGSAFRDAFLAVFTVRVAGAGIEFVHSGNLEVPGKPNAGSAFATAPIPFTDACSTVIAGQVYALRISAGRAEVDVYAGSRF